MYWIWIGFFALILTLLILDLVVFHKKDHDIRLKEALMWTGIWVSIGMAFSVVVYFIYEHKWLHTFGNVAGPSDLTGMQAVLLYLTGYLLEESLSIDNVFVMTVILSNFGIARKYQHRVLFWGILGAIVFRAAMIFGGVWLVNRFSWTFYVFGIYLAATGVKIFFEKEDEEKDPSQSFVVKVARRFFPIRMDEVGHNFIISINGKRYFTRLFVALIAIETTDVVFALDSVPAVLGVTTESFIVMTSNIFAILGLRSLFFVVSDLLSRFSALKPALAALLLFIGLKMIFHSVIKIPVLLSLGIIVAIVATGALYSWYQGNAQKSAT